MGHTLKILRVYDLTEETLGYRVLVDRLWPRGVRKEALRPDYWAKEAAPSAALRNWFSHAPERFDAFAEAYRAELDGSSAAARFAEELAARLQRQDVLLLYAAKDPACNHAVILRDWLEKQIAN
jgi:uncharacterized protein YeaO (DUF488 family)